MLHNIILHIKLGHPKKEKARSTANMKNSPNA